MIRSEKFHSPMFNASSMADIAFLLLTFFMVTTVMREEKGLALLLPPVTSDTPAEPIHKRNLFAIRLNSLDGLMVRGEIAEGTDGLRESIKEFILNYGRDVNLSDHPQKAIVSLKADRGTSHRAFISVLDEVQAAYYEIYAERAGITSADYRRLDLNNPVQKAIYDKGRAEVPMNISIAESDNY